MRRAEAAGVTALVLTIDKPVHGRVWNRGKDTVKKYGPLMIPNLSISVEDVVSTSNLLSVWLSLLVVKWSYLGIAYSR